MNQKSSDILATRLNFDVVAFRGNTRREMLAIAVISFTFTALVLGILAKWLLGMFLIGVGVSFPLAIPVGLLLTSIMQAMKAGKPKGYVKQQCLLWLEKQGIKRSPYLHCSGCWIVKRRF